MNKKQKVFYLFARKLFFNEGGQIRCYLGGSGGVGKSMVINAIKYLFYITNSSFKLRIGAFTGNAADNVEGETLHKLLSLTTFGYN